MLGFLLLCEVVYTQHEIKPLTLHCKINVIDMNISILVLSAPYSSQGAHSAFRYTQAALKSGNKIHRVFFYQDAVHAGSCLATPPQDEFDLYTAWQALKQDYDLDLVICIAAAARRGLINEQEATRHNKLSHNVSEEFELSGLGQLVEACAMSDRIITFGY